MKKSLSDIRKEVNLITDSLGKPVDPEIKELVMGLMFRGIETEGSCEGHYDRGLPYPWVSVSYQQIEKTGKMIARQNRPNIIKEVPNPNIWVIRPSGPWFRIIPQNTTLGLEKMRQQAKDFGLFLQSMER